MATFQWEKVIIQQIVVLYYILHPKAPTSLVAAHNYQEKASLFSVSLTGKGNDNSWSNRLIFYTWQIIWGKAKLSNQITTKPVSPLANMQMFSISYWEFKSTVKAGTYQSVIKRSNKSLFGSIIGKIVFSTKLLHIKIQPLLRTITTVFLLS